MAFSSNSINPSNSMNPNNSITQRKEVMEELAVRNPFEVFGET